MALGKGLSSLIPQIRTRSTIHRESGHDGSARIWHIPLSEITPNPEQPRRNFSHNELEDLVASIKKHGILQPITVSEKADGGYELIVGERRLRATQIAGLATIPAIVRSATQQEKLELALIENIQRQDLNPIEEAFAYKRLIEEFGLTHQEVAEQVGKERPTVSNMLRLLDLPEIVQKALIDGKISTGKARALLSLKDEKEMMKLFHGMIGQSITVRDVERTVAGYGQQSRKGSVRCDPNLLAQEKMLEERLGTKVRITRKGERGQIEIEYYTREELKRLLAEICQ
ncbi:MAG: ParB/RepB/Spo0J family partition protein [Candidatus Magasanikbacteria bacterium]|nr:ParB/RepB/Spo0J family partition protein [Candidatus Magasanikbacteria bacterium]